MKKISLFALVIMMTAALLVGCSPAVSTETTPTEPPAADVTEPIEEITEEATEEVIEAPTEEATEADEEDMVYEGDASSYYIDVAYAEQIGRYYSALSEKWDEEKYFDNGMSALPWHYYEGKALDNVGFGYLDLDYDGQNELIIGAILNADQDPTVFEIWTVVDGEPVMLAQGGSGNRYVLQFLQEDNAWYVVNEASNGAASHKTLQKSSPSCLRSE